MIRIMHPDPWKRLANDWPDVRIEHDDLLGLWAETRWMRSGRIVVVLDTRLNQVERRVCIAHECEHLDRGQPHGTLRASAETRVRQATARWLVPDLEILAETVAVYDLHQAAEQLWVTFPVLVDRLNGLTDTESNYVHERRRRNEVA